MYTREDGSIYFLPDDELPLVLPELEDYKGKNGKAPLENATEWKQYDRNGVKGTRETSTMPGIGRLLMVLYEIYRSTQ